MVALNSDSPGLHAGADDIEVGPLLSVGILTKGQQPVQPHGDSVGVFSVCTDCMVNAWDQSLRAL